MAILVTARRGNDTKQRSADRLTSDSDDCFFDVGEIMIGI